MSGLIAACEVLGDEIAGTEPALLSGSDCARAVEVLARTEKRCAGLRVVLAARAADCNAHRERGYSSPSAWLAETSGVGVGEAKAALATARGLEACPATRDAVLAGALSLAQAAEIAKTEAVAAGSEAELLDLAGRSGLGVLRDEARRRRLQAVDRDEGYRRQRRERYLRWWTDEAGLVRLSGAFTPEVGVALTNRVDTEVDRLLRQAQRDRATDDQGEAESRDMVAADALAKLVLDGGSGRRGGAEVVVVCDLSAFQRGRAEEGEVCHVIGGGPVPVSVARDLAATGFIKAVLHDGTQVQTVAHFGRYRPAELDTALGLGSPPLFPGVRCVDCGRRYGLQWDHIDPVAHHGPTSYQNLQPLCRGCHAEKTRRDRDAGLLTPRRPEPDPKANPPADPSAGTPGPDPAGITDGDASEADRPEADRPEADRPEADPSDAGQPEADPPEADPPEADRPAA